MSHQLTLVTVHSGLVQALNYSLFGVLWIFKYFFSKSSVFGFVPQFFELDFWTCPLNFFIQTF